MMGLCISGSLDRYSLVKKNLKKYDSELGSLGHTENCYTGEKKSEKLPEKYKIHNFIIKTIEI